MPEIGMYFNQAEVDEGILLGRFKRFADIPEQFMDEDIVCDWLHYAGSPIEKYYAQVPQKWRSDGFLQFAAFNGCNVLKDTSPDQTLCYRALVARCAVNDCWSLRDVHPEFRDDEILKAVSKRLKSHEFLNLIKEIDWIGPAMSDALLRECCSDDFEFALDAPPGLLGHDIVEYLDLRWPKVFRTIRDRGRFDLLSEKFSKDGWPGNYNLLEPSTLSQAIEELRYTSRINYPETMYMAYIMRFPLDEVVPAMSGSRLKKLLLEMYPKEALTPYLKHDKGLKGIFLEDALGI